MSKQHRGRVRDQAGYATSRSWMPVTIAAAAAVVVVIGGVVWLSGRQDPAPTAGPGSQATAGAPGPSSSGPTADSSDAAPAGRTVTVPVYYVGSTASGPRLFREFRKVEDTTSTELLVAVNQAVGDTAADPDYRSGFPRGTTATAAALSDGVVTVDLTGPAVDARPQGMSRHEATQAINAVVYTVDGVTQSQAAVAFRIDGKPAKTVLGVNVGSSVSRAAPDEVKSAVSIFSPAQGETVRSGFTVQGEAATFEANVVWELKQGDTVVKQGFTTARECCTLSPYSFTVSAPPGDYTLVVHDTDESDGEGVGTSEDTKDITVR